MKNSKRTQQFETEVRFFIQNINEFKKRIDLIGGKLLNEYSFIDYYYFPKNKIWNLMRKSLRIREWRKPQKPTAIWLSKQKIEAVSGFSFKRSIYPEGKIKLFEGKVSFCKQILDDLGFKHICTIDKKQGLAWRLNKEGLEFCTEKVDQLGWTGEFELDGTNTKIIKKMIRKYQKLLGLSLDQMSSKPLAVIFEEKQKKFSKRKQKSKLLKPRDR